MCEWVDGQTIGNVVALAEVNQTGDVQIDLL